MARRRTPPPDGAARLVEKIERIARISPTTGQLFEEWIDRLIAGEPLESVKAEMDRVLALYNKKRKR
jgi:hypothetical protein